MLSKLTLLLFLALGMLLAGTTVANAQLPSGERQLGKTIIEPGYDDRTGELIYVMTPMGAPFPSHNNQHAVYSMTRSACRRGGRHDELRARGW
jgi:hypothetical protein